MSEEKNIHNYTAADIRDYWAGKLSTKKMHALEKAAMEDPFLADALEGYQYDKSTGNNIAALQRQLAEKANAGAAPVINVRRNKNTWLRIAASIIVIAGLGILVQQVVIKNQPSRSVSMADEKVQSSSAEKAKDTPPVTSIPAQQSSTDSTFLKAAELPVIVNGDIGNPANTSTANLGSTRKTPVLTSDTLRDYDRNPDAKDLAKERRANEQAEFKTAPVTAAIEKKDEAKREIDAERTGIDSIREQFAKQKARSNASQDTRVGSVLQQPAVNEGFMKNDKATSYGLSFTNRYNYRVVDAFNKPVPFANVMNLRDNVGTYTDIRGNFNLVSTDSIMDVQIRSLGYNSASYKLVPSVQPVNLVLKEDDEARKQILALNRKMVSNVTRKDSMELEEPEVGWNNYNTYVANNIQIPENLRAKNGKSDVELSFDIDKNGNPVNIKVTKSSQCKACDDEAIRLLKDGPKWKRKGKKNKTTISIAVDQQ